jgi:hypothetical protein
MGRQTKRQKQISKLTRENIKNATICRGRSWVEGTQEKLIFLDHDIEVLKSTVSKPIPEEFIASDSISKKRGRPANTLPEIKEKLLAIQKQA